MNEERISRAAEMIDSALIGAWGISESGDASHIPALEWRYERMRDYIYTAGELLLNTGDAAREVRATLDWVAGHLPSVEDFTQTKARVTMNPRMLDPEMMHNRSMLRSAQWLLSQWERLSMAASTLRDIAHSEANKDPMPEEAKGLTDSAKKLLRGARRIESHTEPVKWVELTEEARFEEHTNITSRTTLTGLKLLEMIGKGNNSKWRLTPRGEVVAQYFRDTEWKKW
tara:strand:- start:444 stop:1127 length:684 start_codon:yes stop_codon:yes gene_type:complete